MSRRLPRRSSTDAYGQGINREGDLIAVGLARGVIKKGAWLQYDGEMIGQGKEASRRALEEDMSWLAASTPRSPLANRSRRGTCRGSRRTPWRED